MELQRGMVVEVNAGPSLQMHLEPSREKPSPVGEAVVASMFRAECMGRVPIVAVMGDSRSTIVARLTAHLISSVGAPVGLACRDGIIVGDRRIDSADASSARGADNVLLNPLVESAVFEISVDSILSGGLGFDRANVAILLNADKQAFGVREKIEIRDDLVELVAGLVGSVTAEGSVTPAAPVFPLGTVVIDAGDPWAAEIATRTSAEFVFISDDADAPMIREHRRREGKVVCGRAGRIVVWHGSRESTLDWSCPSSATPGSAVLALDVVLPAVAAALALGVSPETALQRLASFSPAESERAAR